MLEATTSTTRSALLIGPWKSHNHSFTWSARHDHHLAIPSSRSQEPAGRLQGL